MSAEAAEVQEAESLKGIVDEQVDLRSRVEQLEQEKAELQERLDFVEELLGPTESQRRSLQEKALAARSAALQAKWRGACIPTKVAGRLDERLVAAQGLAARDAGLLQGGCLPDAEGILQDVSLLGDPAFRPFSPKTGRVKWAARGGLLRLSLEEVQGRFGEEVAQDVLRCARELDEYDASRRVGLELPWHPVEDRELEPAEVIQLMDRELALAANLSYRYHDEPFEEQLTGEFVFQAPWESPTARAPPAPGPPPPRATRGPSRAKRARARSQQRARQRSVGSAAAVYTASAAGHASARGSRRGAVPRLPRLESGAGRRGAGGLTSAGGPRARVEMSSPCALPSLQPTIQEPLQHPLLACMW